MKSLRASKVFCVIDLIHHLPLILEVKEVVTITVKELLKGNGPVHLFEVAIWPRWRPWQTGGAPDTYAHQGIRVASPVPSRFLLASNKPLQSLLPSFGRRPTVYLEISSSSTVSIFVNHTLPWRPSSSLCSPHYPHYIVAASKYKQLIIKSQKVTRGFVCTFFLSSFFFRRPALKFRLHHLKIHFSAAASSLASAAIKHPVISCPFLRIPFKPVTHRAKHRNYLFRCLLCLNALVSCQLLFGVCKSGEGWVTWEERPQKGVVSSNLQYYVCSRYRSSWVSFLRCISRISLRDICMRSCIHSQQGCRIRSPECTDNPTRRALRFTVECYLATCMLL